MEITCPSGLRGVVRKLKVRELAMFSDIKLARKGRVMTEVVKSCWEKTIDRGPYMFPDVSGPLPWDTMLHADRIFAFKEIRIATYGPEFEWEVQCPSEMCKHRFLRIVDLTDMKTIPLSEAGKQHITSGNPLAATVAGKRVRWRLLRAGDDQKLLKYTQEDDVPLIVAGYLTRIVDVEGVDDDDIRSWIENLDIDDMNVMQEKLDATEPLLIQTIDVRCTRCEQRWETAVPLVQAFLRPETKKSSSTSKTPTTTSSAPSSEGSGGPHSQEGPT